LNGIPSPTRLFEKPQLVYKTDKGLLYYRREENQLNYLSAIIGDAVAREYWTRKYEHGWEPVI